MKIVLIVSVIITSGLIGIKIKNKYKDEYLFFKFLKEFHQYIVSNITLFKNNIVEIIDNYIIMHKNKNAKYMNLFLKNSNIYVFNEEIFKKYIKNEEDSFVILEYLNNLGKGEYLFEKEKINNFSVYLDKKIEDSSFELKNKGELYFKLLLAIGAIVAIIIW